eukprot:Rhum_TRINITY_DN10112_c0_g1::Rhum_TRINITY_DN10112_c0_g1_i1::g.36874::m.36874
MGNCSSGEEPRPQPAYDPAAARQADDDRILANRLQMMEYRDSQAEQQVVHANTERALPQQQYAPPPPPPPQQQHPHSAPNARAMQWVNNTEPDYRPPSANPNYVGLPGEVYSWGSMTQQEVQQQVEMMRQFQEVLEREEEQFQAQIRESLELNRALAQSRAQPPPRRQVSFATDSVLPMLVRQSAAPPPPSGPQPRPMRSLSQLPNRQVTFAIRNYDIEGLPSREVTFSNVADDIAPAGAAEDELPPRQVTFTLSSGGSTGRSSPVGPSRQVSYISSTSSTRHRECSICLEVIRPSTSTFLPCRHGFHTTCVRAWMAAKTAASQPTTCPMCREEVPAVFVSAVL